MLLWVKVGCLSGVLVAVNAELGRFFLGGHLSLLLPEEATGLAFPASGYGHWLVFLFCLFSVHLLLGTCYLEGAVVETGNPVAA